MAKIHEKQDISSYHNEGVTLNGVFNPDLAFEIYYDLKSAPHAASL